jgi:hypothetical protein
LFQKFVYSFNSASFCFAGILVTVSRRCSRVAHPESYFTKYTTYTEIKLNIIPCRIEYYSNNIVKLNIIPWLGRDLGDGAVCGGGGSPLAGSLALPQVHSPWVIQ